jgi:hypothetical protein
MLVLCWLRSSGKILPKDVEIWMKMYIILQVKCFYGTPNGSKLTPFEGHGNNLRYMKWQEKIVNEDNMQKKMFTARSLHALLTECIG